VNLNNMEPPPPPPPPAHAGPTSESNNQQPPPTPHHSTASSSSTPPSFPHLDVLTPSGTHPFLKPSKRIHTGADVAHFLTSLAYRDIGVFILQLNRALCPRKIIEQQQQQQNQKVRSFALDSPRPNEPEAVTKLREMLGVVEGMIEEAPPEKGPRRFGNVSFRRWYEILDARVEGLLREYLPARMWADWGQGVREKEEGLMEEVKAYFMGAFGSAQRLDYGTGHELSFLAFLGCLWKLGVFHHVDSGGEEAEGKGKKKEDGEVERSVVLGVFEP
jgi:serine/threonine-protein phosphatase 2A activator